MKTIALLYLLYSWMQVHRSPSNYWQLSRMGHTLVDRKEHHIFAGSAALKITQQDGQDPNKPLFLRHTASQLFHRLFWIMYADCCKSRKSCRILRHFSSLSYAIVANASAFAGSESPWLQAETKERTIKSMPFSSIGGFAYREYRGSL